MKKAFIVVSLAFMSSACSAEISGEEPSSLPASTPANEPAGLPATEVEANTREENGSEGGNDEEPLQGLDCLGPEENNIGQSIADRFEESSYEEVITWFCNGAEFEDILPALLSEQSSDASAEEILVMLADGFTWDEIWQLVGIIE